MFLHKLVESGDKILICLVYDAQFFSVTSFKVSKCIMRSVIKYVCILKDPKFYLTIISRICIRLIHRMNVRTENARTGLFQMSNL